MKKILYIITSAILVAAAVVSCQKPVLVTGVTLDSRSLTMIVGESNTLVATVSPADADNTNVIWSSSNASVAKVENGRVSAISAGTAQVSVKTDDGCFTDACTVTVYEKEILPTGIKLDGSKLSLLEGESVQLTATVSPDNSTDKSVAWTTSDKEVAVVTDGVVTALKAGEAEITATTCNGIEAKCAVTVSCNVSGVALDYPAISLEEGQTQQLTAKVYPSRATDTAVSWKSSDPAVAEVSDAGLVKALKAGTAVVTVKTKDGDFTDECTVTVTSRVSSLELDKTQMSVFVGESDKLKATVKPANASNPEINWYSEDESVATVSSEGEVKGVKAGKTTICATTVDGGKHASCDVVVYNHVAFITLDTEELTLFVGGVSAELVATVLPEDAPDRSVKWTSSDSKVAAVDASGKVSPVGVGEALITATTNDQGLTASCKVTVQKIVLVSSITLNETSARVELGTTLQLEAAVAPEDATDKSLTWTSSDAAVASVGDNGLVTARKVGKATITAKANDASGKTATCEVSVVVPVTEVKFAQSSVTVEKGKPYTLEATVLPEHATVKTLEWSSSDTDVATVDSKGAVTGRKNGTATITARSTDSGVSAECKVTVVTKVGSISLSPTALQLKVGGSGKVVATVTPEDATDKSLTWSSSDATVASVDQSGIVTAKKAGKATLTVKANDGSGKTATCEVSVVVPVTEVKFAQSSVTVEKGKPYTLEATVLPEHATVKTLEWSSSDADVATVDSKGVVTGKKNGTATITARSTDSGVSAECKVTVVTKVGSISLSPTALQLMVGGSGKVVATVTPEDATDKSLTWSSSDATVASVDQSGNVTAKKAGKATITVKANDGSGKTASCTVSVGVPVSEVTLNMTTLNLGRGETETITATVKPDNATDKTITWKSSDPSVATVDANGLVKGIKDGEATVTATNEASGKSAGCTVYVVAKVTEIKVDPAEATIKEGETVRINATALPVDAKDRGLKYQSMKTSVATVSADGVVTGVSEGTAQIKITAKDGYGAQAYFKIEVLPDVVPVESITFNTTSLSMKIGESQTIIATVKPSDQKTAPLKWTSSNPNVASVDDNGKVTAIASGDAQITAMATDGTGKRATCNVKVLEPVKVRSITLDKTNETMVKGSTLTIVATVLPADAANPELKWTSSAPYVASVSSTGEVTAEGEGTATITAAATDGSGVTATCKITVVSELVRVTGIEWINNPPKVLNVGDQVNYAPYIRINPSNATDKAIIWQVQQGGVMVHDGSVYTAVKTGPCNVIAKTHDGEYSCSITVNVKSVPVTGVSISKDAISLKKGESMQLTATVHPDNATNKNVSWGTSDSDVATVSSAGVVNARGKGTATITVKTSDGSKTATCKVTVYGEPGAGESEGVGFEDL